jgi:hypothetical protein
MSVKDHGLDAIRKSAVGISGFETQEFYLRVSNPEGDPIQVTGDQQPSGLSDSFRITTKDISTTASALPENPLTNRNAISILNTSSSTLYIGPTDQVTADNVEGTTSGWEIGPNEIWHIDVTDAITLYAIVASGTARVKILEVA